MTIPQRIPRRIPRRFHCREPALFLLVGGVVAVAGQLLLWWLMGRGLSPGPANAAVVTTTLQLNFLGNRALTPSPGAYLEWIERVNSGLGTTKAAIVIEPDAVPADCYSPERGKLLREAVHRLAAAGHFTYLDAGHPRWKSAGEAAERLMVAGIQEAGTETGLHAAALLWVKRPGESDGLCGGETTYEFAPRQAAALVANTPWVPERLRKQAGMSR